MIARRPWIAATMFRCLVAVATSAAADGSTDLGIA
jgi:hypothetical protein